MDGRGKWGFIPGRRDRPLGLNEVTVQTTVERKTLEDLRQLAADEQQRAGEVILCDWDTIFSSKKRDREEEQLDSEPEKNAQLFDCGMLSSLSFAWCVVCFNFCMV